MKSDLWVEEKHKDICATRFKVKKVLFSGQSEFQSVDVFDTEGHGRMLFNDGLVMLSELDEFIYHEMITHVPMFAHPSPKKVLIIGGGDGGTAREVLRHEIEKCVMVEIDEMVVNACKEYIPQTAACLTGDDRLELLIDDGVKYVAETNEKFDVVIVDSTDPIGPAAPLFGTEFYENVKKVLSDDGVVVSQGEGPFYFQEEQLALLKVLGQVFPKTRLYNFSNMTYPGGLWSFTFASKGLDPLSNLDEARIKKFSEDCQYYNLGVHRSAFELPQFMRKYSDPVLKA